MLHTTTLERIACAHVQGRLVDQDLVLRSQRGTTTIMGEPAVGPHCPTATVTVVVPRKRNRARGLHGMVDVELNAASGAVLRVTP